MEKRKYSPKMLIFISAITIVCVCISIYALCATYHISFSEQQTHDQISQKIPYTQTGTFLSQDYTITIQDVQIDFQDHDKIHLTTRGDVKTKFGDLMIEIDTIGIPSILDNAIYFAPETFTFTKYELSKKAQETAENVGTIGKNALTKYAGDLLKNTSIDTSATKIANGLKEHLKEKIQCSIIAYLKSHPIKKLDGINGLVMTLGIKDTHVTNDNIVIDISILKLTGMSLFIILVSITMIGAAISMPLWAVGIVGLSALFS